MIKGLKKFLNLSLNQTWNSFAFQFSSLILKRLRACFKPHEPLENILSKHVSPKTCRFPKFDSKTLDFVSNRALYTLSHRFSVSFVRSSYLVLRFKPYFFFAPVHFFSRRPCISGRSSRGGARRGGEERRGWVEQDAIGTIRPEDNPPSCPPANRRHLSWTSLRKHEQTKSYSNPLVESKTRTHYGPFGSRRRTAGRRGGAGLGRSGRRRPVAQAHHERTPARAEHKVGGSPRMGLIGSDSAREHEAQGDLEQADADVDSIRPENKHPSGPPANRRDLSWTSLRKQNLTESYVNRWGNEMSG